MAPEPREEIVDVLMEHQAHLAPILVDWLRVEQRVDDPARARAAAIRLLHFNARRGWPVLHELMDTDPEFMEAAFLSMGYAYEYRTPDLTELEIAELYVWLSRHFPAREDPQFEDAHFVGPRESLASWRDSLLDGLRRRGTKGAVVAVEHIVAAFPEKEWLGNALVDAQRAYRDRTWEPLNPYHLDELANSRHARLIRTDEDLSAATLDALDAVQQRLQGDTPSANLLWDSHSRRPKSEEEISDYLKIELERQLREYGVVVNREVQVRRIKPTGLPDRTDLRIEALPKQGNEITGPLKIPSEVKGAWNAGVS